MRRSEVRILPGVLSWNLGRKRPCFYKRVELGVRNASDATDRRIFRPKNVVK